MSLLEKQKCIKQTAFLISKVSYALYSVHYWGSQCFWWSILTSSFRSFIEGRRGEQNELKPSFKHQRNAMFHCWFLMKNLTLRRLPKWVKSPEFYSATEMLVARKVENFNVSPSYNLKFDWKAALPLADIHPRIFCGWPTLV